MVAWYTKKDKRAEGMIVTSGGSAAALVALIMILMVGYVLFLPPDERVKLLENDSNGDNGNGIDASDLERVIFTESPRTLDKLNFDEVEHFIPPINLFASTDAEVIKEVDSIYTKYGIFDKKFGSFDFYIENLDTTDNVLMTFNVKKMGGSLKVLVNGNAVMEKEITQPSQTVTINGNYLDNDNTVEFQVSDVGWAFWRTNEYLLENIQIIGDVTDVTTQESRNTFTLTEEEKDNLESVSLKFFADCVPKEVGKLEVFVNSENIYSSIPDCGALRPIEFSPSFLNEGDNRLVFRTSRGNYLIDSIVIKTKLKEAVQPVYYFDIEEDELAEIEDGDLQANLTFTFLDDVELKQLKVHVNGHRFGISTYDTEYSRIIDVYLREGSNAIKIEPEDRIEIVEIKLELEEV